MSAYQIPIFCKATSHRKWRFGRKKFGLMWGTSLTIFPVPSAEVAWEFAKRMVELEKCGRCGGPMELGPIGPHELKASRI